MDAADQLFELALDLPERERARLLRRVASEQPELAAKLRHWLQHPNCNTDFACSTRPGPGAGPDRRGSTGLDRAHHVAVQVADVGRAVRWYTEVFACDVEYEDATWALLRLANVRLALVLPQQHPPHLAIARRDAGRFGPLTEHRDGTRSVYVTDPWGNSIEVMDTASLPADEPAADRTADQPPKP